MSLVVLVLSATGTAEALTGNQWMGWEEASQGLYVIGVMDAWVHVRGMFEEAGLKPGPSAVSRGVQTAECARAQGMTYGQMGAIIRKYMAQNPDKWQYSMAWLVWTAMTKACPS